MSGWFFSSWTKLCPHLKQQNSFSSTNCSSQVFFCLSFLGIFSLLIEWESEWLGLSKSSFEETMDLQNDLQYHYKNINKTARLGLGWIWWLKVISAEKSTFMGCKVQPEKQFIGENNLKTFGGRGSREDFQRFCPSHNGQGILYYLWPRRVLEITRLFWKCFFGEGGMLNSVFHAAQGKMRASWEKQFKNARNIVQNRMF